MKTPIENSKLLQEKLSRQSFLLDLTDALRLIEDPVAIQEQGAHMLAQYLATKDLAAEQVLIQETEKRIQFAFDKASNIAALRKSEAKYRTLFNSIDEGYSLIELLYDAEGRPYDWRFHEVNPTYIQQVGFDPSGKTVQDLQLLIEPFWLQIYEQVVSTGESKRVEHFSINRGHWFNVFASRVGGEGSRMIAVIFDDITERKRREQNQNFIAEISNELTYLDTIESMIAASLGEKIGRYFDVQQCMFCEVVQQVVVTDGWNAEGARSLKGTYNMLDYLTQSQRDANNAGQLTVVNDIATDPRIHAEAYAALDIAAFIVVPFVRNDFWCFQLCIVDNQPRQWRIDEIDVMRQLTDLIWSRFERARAATAIRDSERRFRHLVQELQQADKRKDEFLAILAHELRNPLSPIKNAVYLLKQKHCSEDQSLIQIIDRQLDHMLRLVDDLLEVSRIATGKIALQKQPIDLSEVLSNALEQSNSFVSEYQHQVRVSLAATPCIIHGDLVRLTQVFANLLINSAKYTPAKGIINISVYCEREEAVVSIQDNGIGISPEMLPKIFDLFTQDETASFNQGLGIGLAMVRSLVELHGGSVSAHSAGQGCGSEFMVRLPIDSTGIKNKENLLMSTESNAPLRQLRLLLVDDNPDITSSLAMVLQSWGIHVQTVHSGAAALLTLEKFHPHIMLLDIGMPDMDGYMLAEKIRQNPKFSTIKLVALTGWNQAEDRARSKAAGFDEHLAKPMDMDNLQQLLVRMMAERITAARQTPPETEKLPQPIDHAP